MSILFLSLSFFLYSNVRSFFFVFFSVFFKIIKMLRGKLKKTQKISKTWKWIIFSSLSYFNFSNTFQLGLLPTVNIGEFVERNILKIGNSSVDDYFVGLAKKHDEPIEKNLYIQPKLNRLQRSYSDTSALAPQGRNQNQQGFFAVART